MQPVRLTQDELIARFGLPGRLAVRIGALLARGVGVSAVVAEMAAEPGPLQKLLLDRSLLDGAGELDAARLLTLQDAHESDGAFADTPLALADGTGDVRVVLCLEEELLAVGSPPVIDGPSEDAAHALVASGASGLARLAGPEVESLFTSEEVARLKLTLLTGTDPAAKIEAIRKLRLLHLEAGETGALLLQALQDDAPAVRSEAANALTALGLSERIAGAIARLSAGEPAEQDAAVRTLERAAGDARDAELGVVMAVLLGTLKTDGSLPLQRQVLRALAAIAPRAAGHDALMRELARQMSRLVLNHYRDLATDVYRVVAAVGPHTAAMRDEVRAQHDDAPTPAVRSFWLGLRAELSPDDGALRACIAEMAERAARGDELDPATARLATALRTFGEAGVYQLLDQLEQVRDDRKETVLTMLVTVFHDTPHAPAVADAVAQRLVQTYPLARPPVRLVIIENPFMMHPAVAPETRRRAARMVLNDFHEFRLDRTQDVVGRLLRRLGTDVLPELLAAVHESRYSTTRLQAATAVGDIAGDVRERRYPAERLLPPDAPLQAPRRDLNTADPQPPDDAVAAALLGAFDDLAGLLDGDFPDKAPLYVALGQLAACGVVPADRLDAFARRLCDELAASSWVYSIVESLGYVVAAHDLPRLARVEVADRLLGLLDMRLPESLSTVKQTEDGPVFVLGHETTAYTDLLPSVMQGLARAAISPANERVVHDRIVDRLLVAWGDLVEARQIWSPRNVVDLAGVLGQIARAPVASQATTNRIVDALMPKAESLSVMAVLGELIGSGEDSPRMAALAHRLFGRLQDRLLEDDRPEFVERQIVLATMCRIAMRRQIGTTDADAARVREQTVQLAFEAVRDGMTGLAPLLRHLASRDAVAAELRHEIDRRLDRYGLS